MYRTKHCWKLVLQVLSNTCLQWEVWSVKAQSYHHRAVWNVFLPKQQTQSLLTQSQTTLSALHILQTELLPHTARKFLVFPAHVTEQLHDQLPWSHGAQGGPDVGRTLPLFHFRNVPGWSHALPFPGLIRTNKTNPHSTHNDKTRLHLCNHKFISPVYLRIPTSTQSTSASNRPHFVQNFCFIKNIVTTCISQPWYRYQVETTQRPT